jgi:hypothetical protein
MEKVVVRLRAEAFAHVERLADQAGVSEADIVAGLVELDMKRNGPAAADPKVVEAARKLLAMLEGKGMTVLGAPPKVDNQLGRPRAFDKHQEMEIMHLHGEGLSEKQIARQMQDRNVPCSRGSVRRVILRHRAAR